MDTISLWKAISPQPQKYSPLQEDLEVDVAIIGGGITGVTAAMPLIRAGKTVAILEASRVGENTTGYSTGNLYVAVQPYYQSIVKKFGFEQAKAIAQTRKAAIDFIEKMVNESNIKCNFSRRPWFIHTKEENEIAFLEREVEYLKQMDIPIDYVNELPLALKFKKAALMPNQARYNPLAYVHALAEKLQQAGCKIYENTRVIGYEEKKTECHLHTSRSKIKAKKTIVATHTPIGINPVQLFTAPYRSYVVAVKTTDGQYPEGHFWDLNNPHHAICTHPIRSDKPELLIVAGSHHKVGQAKDAQQHYLELEEFLRQNFNVSEIAYQWSAQHYHSADDVPYIGLAHRSAKHTFIATGFFADGLIYGTLAGMILADSILHKQNEMAKIYEATRFKPFASAAKVIKENFNVFLQYLKDLPSMRHQYNDVKPGDGRVVSINGEKWAVSRDTKNQLHIVSAVCTHMKCVVNWNDAEKTWDCPCHGSRFKQTGEVIEGPAEKHLKVRSQ